MEIKTKYSELSEVFFMHDNKVESGYVEEIRISVKAHLIKISYNIVCEKIFDAGMCEPKVKSHIELILQEEELFKTKEDLIKSL